MRSEVLRRALTRHLPVYFSLTTAAIAQPLLQMYGANLTVFTTANLEGWRVILFMATVIVVPPLVLLGAELAVSMVSPRIHRTSHLGAVWLALVVLVALLLRAVPLGAWPVAVMVIGAVAAGLTALYARATALGQWLRWMSPFALAVGILFTLAAREVVWVPEAKAIDVIVTDDTTPSAKTPPGDVSVLWLILDEFSVSSLMTVDGRINAERFPGFAALAETSTWYRNNLTVSKDTIEAVPAMLTGRYPRMGRAPTLATYPENLFTITNGQMEMDVNETITRLCPRDQCRYQAVSGGDDIANAGQSEDSVSADQSDIYASEPPSADFTAFLRDASIVLGHKILPAGLRSRLPPIDEGWGDFGNGGGGADDEGATSGEADDSEAGLVEGSSTTVAGSEAIDESELSTGDTIADDLASNRDRTLQPLRFRAVVGRAARSSQPTLHFSHLMIPHKPWLLTPDLRYYDWRRQYKPGFNPTKIDQLRDEYMAFLSQVAAVDKLVGEMVETLKRSANWDRTMIIVLSDHGQTFEPGLSKRKTINASRPESLEDIFRPPLFIKYPDQQQGEVNDCPVQTIDVLPTLLAVKGLTVATTFEGVDLRTVCPTRPTRVVKWAYKQAELSTGVEALLARVRRMDEFVPHSGNTSSIVAIGPYRGLLGESVVASPGATSPVSSWKVREKAQFANISDAELATIPYEVSGYVSLATDMPPETWLAVTIDGRVAGFLGELVGLKANGLKSFRSLVDYAQLTAGAHELGLVAISGSATAPVFSPVLAPS